LKIEDVKDMITDLNKLIDLYERTN
jgi:hypothetical protein